MEANDTRRQLAVALGRPDIDWEERFELLSRILLVDRRLVVLLDNFEDNQGEADAVKDGDLARLLSRWLLNPGRTRFLITSRYPFELAERAHRRLEASHLGPLSFAETRKLFWRLPGLDALTKEDQQRAFADVGGHPRALEYLDALLRGGQARFQDVADRMEGRLEKKGIRRPEAWMKGVAGDLDRALAETVTLAVDDVLLDRLLDRLEAVPLARSLIVGASVYRVPVDLAGLALQVGDMVDPIEGEAPDRALSMAIPHEFEDARLALEDMGLLAPAGWIGVGADTYLVHRWTATAILDRSRLEEKAKAHRQAAQYWRWRIRYVPQSREAVVEQLLQARHHHYEAEEIDQAVEVTESVCSQLSQWGAYRREEQLCRETLTWLPKKAAKAAVFLHGLGTIALQRGEIEQALDWYQKSLRIEEELGIRAGMASSYHQLGRIAQDRGEIEQALDWYQKSLRINEELGNRAGMAISYHQLGMLAQDRGEIEQALDWYQKALRIDEELGNRAGMATSYGQLAVLITQKGTPAEAVPLTLHALAIHSDLRSPEIGIDIHWLRRQRELLGKERFEEILRQHLDENGVKSVLGLMEAAED